MMTCARVRVYERKKEEQRQLTPSPSPSFQQPSSYHSSPENCSAKEPDAEQQPLKPITCDLEDDSDKSQVAAPVYVPTNNTQRYPFRHILASTCLLIY
uniref:MAX dimerization protein MGA n=1 Tax=Molossus molossus TaxID=27622 RepID=A0A7J8JYI0_MOLMO|nr:MAX dimerization protein MGA [Molossus molossus]